MTVAATAIKIHGVKELQRTLKQLDGESQKKLRLVFNEVAETVADTARARTPFRTGRARASIRTSSTQRLARISGGNKRNAPYFPWLDYGGAVGRNKSIKRPFLKEGRYLYPAYRVHAPQIPQLLHESLERMLRSVGWTNVSGGTQ